MEECCFSTIDIPGIQSIVEDCTGCGACAAHCPQKCIRMDADSYGFLRPVVDIAACVGCGVCDKTCPVLNRSNADDCVGALWALAKDSEMLNSSSSGGIFGILADHVFKHDGGVVGARWSDGCQMVEHACINDRAELDAILRSKYVQSSIGKHVYDTVRDNLVKGKLMLFCGTACQVAGMKSFLGNLAETENFISIDIACHGVPSPLLWKRWLDYLSRNNSAKVISVNFRDKTFGWQNYSVLYQLRRNNVTKNILNAPSDDWYMRAFLSNASLRSSCLNCKSKRFCGSDITLGDFWGIEKQHPEVNCEKGASAVIINTKKGETVLSGIINNIEWGNSSFEKLVSCNPAIAQSVKPHPERAAFLNSISEGVDIATIMKKWSFNPPLSLRLKTKVKRVIRKWDKFE